jgi:hypothetical protein
MRLPTALLYLLLIFWARPGYAQTDIHRCIDAAGHALFTDQTCAAMQATAINPAVKPSDNATHATTLATAPSEPPPTLCAATFDALRQSVIDAFANHNANRVAGLMLWNGYDSRAAVATIQSLNTLMQQPLLDAGPPDDDAPASSGSTATASADAPAAGSQLVLHLAGNDASGNPRAVRYSIVHRYGCLWLRALD